MKERILPLAILSALLCLSGVFCQPGNCKTQKKITKKQTAPARKNASSQNAAEIKEGIALYKAHDCAACHNINGQGCKDGLPLDHVGSTRSEKFLMDHLKDPELHVSKNPKAFGGDPVNLMPAPDLEVRQIKPLIKYLRSLK